MRIILNLIIFASVVIFCGNSYAAPSPSDCLVTLINSNARFSLKPTNNHFNCFMPENSEQSSAIQIAALSIASDGDGGQVSIEAYQKQSNGIFSLVRSYPSINGAIAASLPTNGKETSFIVRTVKADGLTRNVNVMTTEHDGTIIITLVIDGDSKSKKPSLGIAPGIVCDRDRICSYPESAPSNLSENLTHSEASGSPAPACTASTAPPPQFNKGPKKFDINRSLIAIQFLKTQINDIPGFLEIGKMQLMFQLFYTNQPFDLKNNKDYLTDEKFGNFFYGAAAAEMGYSKEFAIKAGAVIQQVQNYQNERNEAFKDMPTLIQKAITAGMTGYGDNPGDSASVATGYDYAVKIFDKDANASNTDNSCPVPDPSPSPTTGSGSESFSFWSGVTLDFNPIQDCIGNCGERTVTGGPKTPPKEIFLQN